MTFAELSEKWRGESTVLRANGAIPQADLVERHVAELETALQGADLGRLSPAAAAEVSGYSSDHLRRLVREGRLTNHGTAGKARYRLSELPRKAGLHKTGDSCTVRPTREQIARAVVNGD